ncbi:hypothetical protein FRB94_007784 [Tulasnella sp. JGI-2019a]|nr:hypothetical protein FRB94_007784 [Tulasnella sp. JGI-2019a]
MPPIRRQRDAMIDEFNQIVKGDSPRPSPKPWTPESTELPPIHRLPIELMTRIFSLTVNSSHSGAYAYHEQLEQLRLAARGWDEIIKSSPSFWSVIDCRFSDRILAMALVRSKGHWLDVDLRPPHRDNLHGLLRSLLGHAHRIRSICVVAHMLRQPLAAKLLERSRPFLIEYGVEDYTGRDGRKMLEEMHPDATPRLRHLTLENVGVPPLNSTLLSRLRSLVLHTACSLSQILVLLCSCSSLVVLDICGEHYEPVESESFCSKEYQRVPLPQLHTLSLNKLHLADVRWILRHLDTPNWVSLLLLCRVDRCDDVINYARNLLDQFILRLGSVIRFCPPTSAATVTIGREQLSCEISGRRMRIDLRGLASHPEWEEGWRTIVRRIIFESGLGTRPIYLLIFREFSGTDLRNSVIDWSIAVTELHIGSAEVGASKGRKQAQAMLIALGHTDSHEMLESGHGGKVAWTFPNVRSVAFDRCPVDGAMLLKIVKARSKRFVAAAHIVEPSPITSLHFFEVTGLSPEVLRQIKAVVRQVVVVEPQLSSFGTAELGRSFSLDSISSV